MASQSPSTPPQKTTPVPPNAPRKQGASSGRVQNVQNAPTDEIHTVIAFNDKHVEIYIDHTAVGGIVLLVDRSGSISGPNSILLRTAVAAMTKGTRAHGKFVIPVPDGGTAIIAAVEHCLTLSNCGTIYLFTDGEENCWSGPIKVGTEPDGTPKMVDISFYGSQGGSTEVLADYLQAAGVKVCILGIGAAAKPMVDVMVGRRNVFCGHIAHGADTKAVVSVVRTLKHVCKGGRSSVTRNGTQHALLVSLTDDVQAAIQKMTPAEMDEFDDAVGSVIISGTDIVTPSDLRRHMEVVENAYDESIPDENLSDVRAALLLAMEAMCNEDMPGALITSKHSAVIGVPKGWRPFRRHCNRLLSRLAGADVLNRAPAVGDGGKIVNENGHQHKFSAGCAQYSCPISKAAVTGLAEDEDWATARADLPAPKRKRKRTANTPPKKRVRVN
jgi:hypothetical protein